MKKNFFFEFFSLSKSLRKCTFLCRKKNKKSKKNTEKFWYHAPRTLGAGYGALGGAKLARNPPKPQKSILRYFTILVVKYDSATDFKSFFEKRMKKLWF